MSLGLKGWLAVTAALCVAVLAVASALSGADHRADKAEAATGLAKEETRGETIRADTNEAVAIRGTAAADAQVRVERVTHTVIREVEKHAASQTPIDPALARAWVVGLRRMCDEAGPHACAGDDAADRVDGAAGDGRVPARPAS
ncbi:MAG: hypothetical protein ACRC7C_14370 [Beijerinckiaceae bacterium]